MNGMNGGTDWLRKLTDAMKTRDPVITVTPHSCDLLLVWRSADEILTLRIDSDSVQVLPIPPDEAS